MIVDEVLAAERAGDGELVRLTEREHSFTRLLRPAALADDDERSFGAGEQLPQALEILLARCRLVDVHGHAVLDLDLLGQHVLRQPEHDRPGRPESASVYARATSSGIRSALSISQAAFAIPPKTRP